MFGEYSQYYVFLGMLAIAVFFLIVTLLVPTFGTSASAAKKLRKRTNKILGEQDQEQVSIVREKYLKSLSPFERRLMDLPGMENLSKLVRQAGSKSSLITVLMLCTIFALISGFIFTLFLGNIILALPVAIVAFFLPILKFKVERTKRFARFEEQLPEAIDMIVRAMRAGHPFANALNLVGDQMKDPIGSELKTTFYDINYGLNIKDAFLSLLSRVPSVSLLAVVTAVSVQKKSGGNLAEILSKISTVLRKRFHFQREIKTLSGAGKLAAWILTMLPFVLAAFFAIAQPDYLPILFNHPAGMKIVFVGFILLIIGMLWIRKLIRIEV